MADVTKAAEGDKKSNSVWSSGQAYVLALICLAVGIAFGYFVRGSRTDAAAPSTAAAPSAQTPPAGSMPQQVTPEQMKHMADEQAKPLLAELAQKPKDTALLAKVGNVYYDGQQYQEAIGYYKRALDVQPANADIRTDMATAYWYLGETDRAIAEFENSLKSNPTHPGTLFNLGVVKWQGKMDVQGAVAAWQKLLDTNPNYPGRAQVETYIARAKQHANIKPGTKTDKPATP